MFFQQLRKTQFPADFRKYRICSAASNKCRKLDMFFFLYIFIVVPIRDQLSRFRILFSDRYPVTGRFSFLIPIGSNGILNIYRTVFSCPYAMRRHFRQDILIQCHFITLFTMYSIIMLYIGKKVKAKYSLFHAFSQSFFEFLPCPLQFLFLLVESLGS